MEGAKQKEPAPRGGLPKTDPFYRIFTTLLRISFPSQQVTRQK